MMANKSHFGFAKCVLEFTSHLGVLCKSIYSLIVLIKMTYLELLLFICHLWKSTFCSCSCKKMYYSLLIPCQK